MPDELIGLLAAIVAATAAPPPATRAIAVPVAMTKLRVLMPSPHGFLVTLNLHSRKSGSPQYKHTRHSGNDSVSITFTGLSQDGILLLAILLIYRDLGANLLFPIQNFTIRQYRQRTS